VTNSTDGTLTRIDPVTGRTTRTLPAIVGASGVAVGFGRVWVVSPPSGRVIPSIPVPARSSRTSASVSIQPPWP